jgi:hypothetical protein
MAPQAPRIGVVSHGIKAPVAASAISFGKNLEISWHGARLRAERSRLHQWPGLRKPLAGHSTLDQVMASGQTGVAGIGLVAQPDEVCPAWG